MCGIAGIVSTRAVERPEILLAMRDTMCHRGPDDAGAWWNAGRTVGLAHRRLSILDLTERGHQPMQDPAGRVTLVFNGQIYNFRELRRELEGRGHRFRSGTDTEVLVHAYLAWGTACLERLNGMFAFALYDREDDLLFAARDRAGEKPFFYHRQSGRLLFGSELKGLLAHPEVPRELDRAALDFYLAYGYVPGDRCLLRGVQKLPPGHALTLRPGGEPRVWSWWRLPDPPPPGEAADPRALEAELEALLLDSVRMRLFADVPVAVLLSGGIDSSLVTAMVARASDRPVVTVTATFPGHPEVDEAARARAVAARLGTDHHELEVDPGAVELLPLLARQYDEPIADSSIVPTFLVMRALRRHAVVALGGEGGDELFGGYPHHAWIQRLERLRRVIPLPVRRAMSGGARRLPVGTRGRNHLIGFSDGMGGSLSHVNLYFDAATRRRLLAPSLAEPRDGHGAPERWKSGLARQGTPLQAATASDFRAYLPDDLLVKVDRAAMLNSLEVRAPFLDPRVVEFAFGRVPDSLRATTGGTKILTRRLAARLLPGCLDLERKQGFSLPLGAWFRGGWGRYVEEVLEGAEPGLWNPAVPRKLLAAQRAGRKNTQRLFALTMLELWRREYRVALPGDDVPIEGDGLTAPVAVTD